MLDLFRKRGLASVVYSALMGAVIVVFVIQFRPNANSPLAGLTQKCVAKVRGTCIDERDWIMQQRLLRSQNDSGSINWGKAAVDSLVERTLLEQEAARIGLRVSEDDVMHEIVRWRVHVMVPVTMRPQAQNLGIDPTGVRWMQFGTKEKPFDQHTFEQVVSSITQPAEFLDAQAHEILAARMIALIAQRVKVSDVEAFDQYVHERSTTTLQYVKLDPKFFADHFLPLDLVALNKWAAEHKAEVDAKAAALPKDQEKRLLKSRHILVEAKKDDPGDKKAAAKKKADDLLEQVKKGEDFGKLAKEHSSDPGSKDNGGEYDWTSGYEYVPEYRDALAKMKPGEALVVETQFGFHVLQLMNRLDGDAALAYPLYRDEKGAELAKAAAQKIADAVKGQLPVALNDAVKAKVEDQKKSGKTEADALAQVVADETKARLQKAIDDTLSAMAPAPAAAPAKKDDKAGAKKDDKAGAKKDDKDAAAPPPSPAWTKDDRKPRVEESTPFNKSGAPVAGVDDPTPLLEAADKLTKEAPLAGPVAAGGAQFVLVLKDRHAATREEFDKEKITFVGRMLAKKREDEIVNHVTALREGLQKGDLVIEQRYVEPPKKGAPGEAPPQPAPMPLDDF